MFERFLMRNHDVSDLAISLLLRDLALSVVFVFGAIFLYGIGTPIVLIFGFYLAFFSTDLFMTLLSGAIVTRIGYKHTILLAQVPLIIHVFALSRFTEPSGYLLLIGAIGGLANALYWTSHHGIMASRSDAAHRSSETAYLDVMSKVAGVIGPIIGGFAILAFGFATVYFAAASVLVVSALFLFRTPEIRSDDHVSLRHLTDGIRTRDFLASMGLGVDIGVNANVWPLILSLTLLSTAGIGVVTGVSFATGVLVSLLLTLFADGRERTFLIVSGYLTLIAWLLRTLLLKPVLFVSEPLYGASKPLMTTAFLSNLYADSQGRLLQTVMIRRMGIISGRILAVCIPVLTGMLWPALIVASFAALLPMLVAK